MASTCWLGYGTCSEHSSLVHELITVMLHGNSVISLSYSADDFRLAVSCGEVER
jgi:hypothetical protein